MPVMSILNINIFHIAQMAKGKHLKLLGLIEMGSNNTGHSCLEREFI